MVLRATIFALYVEVQASFYAAKVVHAFFISSAAIRRELRFQMDRSTALSATQSSLHIQSLKARTLSLTCSIACR
jgi:hypothetical protein